jgi:hypothetical protein
MALSREQRITRALKIIGDKAKRAAVEQTVDWYIEIAEEEVDERSLCLLPGASPPIGRYEALLGPINKDEKKALAQLGNRLRLVRNSFQDCPELEDMFRMVRGLDQWLIRLEKLEKLTTGIAALPLPRPTKADWRKETAVMAAAGLLEDEHDIALTSTKPRRATDAKPEALPGSKFCQLSAVIFGDPSADLHHYCEAWIGGRSSFQVCMLE